LIDQSFFETLLFLSVEVVVIFRNIGERLSQDLLASDSQSLLSKAAFETFLASLKGLEYGFGA
jgi:hypothetical protein